MCCYAERKAHGNPERASAGTLAEMKSAEEEKPEPGSPKPENSGPSWILMLFLIFLAMLAATGIAWAFIHPMLPSR